MDDNAVPGSRWTAWQQRNAARAATCKDEGGKRSLWASNNLLERVVLAAVKDHVTHGRLVTTKWPVLHHGNFTDAERP